jgi:2-polyprenyl-3-methyl-5-hydroxy-6-metoxy-1,4-benzoquinol methylase
VTLDKPLPVRLREMWRTAEQNGMSLDDCVAAQKRELDQFAAIWTRALQLPGPYDLVSSTLHELSRWRGIDDLAIVRRHCEDATRSLKVHWEGTVPEVDACHVEKFYDAADGYIEELMWWHTLADDNSPLAYVAAMEFALSADCKSYLDFGSGVGSGALLFRRHGFNVTLADISGLMLSFCKYRFEARGCDARFIDLKKSTLPAAAFDFITAMDVFEHLVDPVGAVDSLAVCLKPGGYIFGRFACEVDLERPQHIVRDFRPVFDRFLELGFQEVFHDDWLWGHQVFQKSRNA